MIYVLAAAAKNIKNVAVKNLLIVVM